MSLRDTPAAESRMPIPWADAGAQNGVATGYMSEAALEQHSKIRVDVPGQMDVVDSCGDNRAPTPDSAAHIDEMTGPDTMPMLDGYASIFGGPVGKAMAFMLAGIANARTPREKQEFIRSVGGIKGVMAMVREVRGPNSVLHSDTDKEGGSLHFDVDPAKPFKGVGCLYNGSQGRVLEMVARHRDTAHHADDHKTRKKVRSVITADLHAMFGNDGDRDSPALLDAFGRLLNELDYGKDHSFGRQDYQEQERAGMPIVILGGEHPSVTESGLLINFDIDQVGNPVKAHELGLDPYRSDLGRIAFGIGAMLIEHNIPTDLFFKAALMLSVAVRAALVAEDSDMRLHGMADPLYLPVGVVGDPTEAARIIDSELGVGPKKNRTHVL